EEATTPLSVVLDSHDVGDLVFLIGPEGGLTAQEVEMSNMTPARLGPQILRTETAGVTAAALGAWHLGRLG
ncbi:RsmE family RNA methyltransferase, partial [Pseudoalteromonas sp. SYSU M81241]